MINSFTNEVIDKLKYYVYRLIDPRDGATFYVGKGKGNRVFAHVNCALENYNQVDYLTKEDDPSSLKIKRIRDINNSGLNTIHVIQRWGLTEKEAYEVESALIDAYSLGNLTNLVKGHGDDRGVSNTEVIQRELSCTEYTDSPSNPKYIIIKTSWQRVNECNSSIYEATRYCWVLSPAKAKNYPYVLAVINGIVRDVFEVERWAHVKEADRYEFFGHEAPEHIRRLFINHRIPKVYSKKGLASPVLYSKV